MFAFVFFTQTFTGVLMTCVLSFDDCEEIILISSYNNKKKKIIIIIQEIYKAPTLWVKTFIANNGPVFASRVLHISGDSEFWWADGFPGGTALPKDWPPGVTVRATAGGLRNPLRSTGL